MEKEGKRDNLHYSERGGHFARGQYWKEVKREQRLESRRRKESPDETYSPGVYSPLVGSDVLIFERRR